MRNFRKEHNIRYVSGDKVNNGYKKTTIYMSQSTTYTYGLGVVGLVVVGLGVVGLGVVGLGVVGFDQPPCGGGVGFDPPSHDDDDQVQIVGDEWDPDLPLFPDHPEDDPP
jgi:hypothetical protein